MVICLERGADLYMAQLMPLPLTVSCFSKIQIGFTFLVPADLGSPGQRAVKRVQCSNTNEYELMTKITNSCVSVDSFSRRLLLPLLIVKSVMRCVILRASY